MTAKIILFKFDYSNDLNYSSFVDLLSKDNNIFCMSDMHEEKVFYFQKASHIKAACVHFYTLSNESDIF